MNTNKQIKILILTNNAGGLYFFRNELILELISKKYEVHYSVPEVADNEYVVKLCESGAVYHNTKIDRRGMNPFKDLNIIRSYSNLVKKIEPDVILTYTIKPNIYGIYVAYKHKIPVLMNITGIGSTLYSGRLKRLIKYLYKRSCGKATHIFFQNSFNYDFFLKNNLVAREKTTLLPGSGVNLERFKPQSKTTTTDKIRFLFLGRVMKEKGINEFIECASSIKCKFSNSEFTIVGDIEEPEYQEILEENKAVTYLGPSKDVREQIKEADCIINPTYHEGMSNVLQEAASMAKPLLGSNIPGCREIIEDGKNGFLFEPKSSDSLEKAIIKFIELSEEQKITMGKHSRLKVEKEFDRNIVVDTYMKIIKEESE